MSDIFTRTLDDLRRQNAKTATPTQKTSSARTEPTLRDKMSAVDQRNKKLSSVGGYLVLLGETGFQSVAMQKLSQEGMDDVGDAEAQDMSTDSTTNGLPEPVADSTITQSLVDGEPVPNPGDPGPLISTLSRGGTPPDTLTDPANRATTDADPENLQPEVGAAGDAADLATPPPNSFIDNISKASQFLQQVTGGRWVEKTSAQKVLKAYGLKDSVDAVLVLKKSADYRSQPFFDFLGRLELHAPKANLMRSVLINKTSAADVESEIAAAKRIIEAAVKSTKTLPEAAEISQVAGVSPTAANIALQEVAELIAASGGSVGSAMGAAAAGAPIPSAVGAPPPPMGAAPGAPMGAPMGGGMPTAPPAPAMPPGGDPSMMATAAAGTRKKVSKRVLSASELLSIGRRIMKQSAPTDLSDLTREEPSDGGPEGSELVHDPGPPGATPLLVEVSPTDQQMIDEALSSNANNVSVDQDDLEGYRREGVEELLNTAVSNPGTNGLLSSTEPVKGTFEGNLGPSSASGSEYPAKASGRRKVSEKLPCGCEKGECSCDGSEESKESSVSRILSKLWPELSKKSEAVAYADGGGTGNIVTQGNAAGAQVSTKVSPTLEKATRFVEKVVMEQGRVPDTQSVMRSTGANEDEAKTAIARGTSNE